MFDYEKPLEKIREAYPGLDSKIDSYDVWELEQMFLDSRIMIETGGLKNYRDPKLDDPVLCAFKILIETDSPEKTIEDINKSLKRILKPNKNRYVAFGVENSESQN